MSSQLLAEAVNALDAEADASHLTMSFAELWAAMADVSGDGNHLTMSVPQMMAAAGGGNAATMSENELLAGAVNSLSDSADVSHLRLTTEELYMALRDAADAGDGGGGETPAWVPANAVIHIDLVGGDPQGRAWVQGTGEVAVDTLLGADANTESFSETSSYSALNLRADGYIGIPAAIGAARTALMAGCTSVARFSNGAVAAVPAFAAVFCGSLGFVAYTIAARADGSVEAETAWNGTDEQTAGGLVNDAEAAENCIAFTATPSRLEAAVNGSAPLSVMITDDWEADGDEIVAFFVDCDEDTALQSITIYDPLPDTTGLSALSAV